MDLHKLAHELGEVFKGSQMHLPLFAGLISIMRKPKEDLKDKISDLGELGDNVPTTLIISLSSRRMAP